ncbi:uncharacterized protein LAESUDRAFT_447652 [Laetiporus sulphureus 93-53]|uniref:F-box domain-containing protein n=1 Tax=Laetiporus sulphureus 93-53 TaxID=1314785 RepID=A0A165BYC1_9APHY|nr:uncharacterized protein LAESUDRAFT_447652 [Laetiporus sulphureus 93-53]KZT01872.1 hypothetical protein LAESUDRAFT_447652 [Laetiporus sulphureus 93-53]
MAGPADTTAAPPINDPKPPRLPPEICERIIDHLDPRRWLGSRPTLLNCALVCRGWYAQSRAVLFEKPTLSTRKQAIACARSLRRIPLLADRVRSLVIGYSSGPEMELASTLLMLAGKIPKLASLTFSRVSFAEHCSMRHLVFCSLHEFSYITSLRLQRVKFPSASSFFQLICSFPHLQHLLCYRLRWSIPRSMAPLPEHRRMPLTEVTSLRYDLSCFNDIGHILLGLVDHAIFKELVLRSPVSTAALTFTQDMLNRAGSKPEKAIVTFHAPKEDADGYLQSLLLHPTSFEANVNLQALELGIFTSEVNDAALFVRSALLPLLNTISSRDLEIIHFSIRSHSKWETDTLLSAFDPEVCTQIDDLLAEGHFAELQAVFIDVHLVRNAFDDSQPQHVIFCTEICARFPRLNDKSMLITTYLGRVFPSDVERALKAKTNG